MSKFLQKIEAIQPEQKNIEILHCDMVGKFKVRPIAGHEPNWNHATSKTDIPSWL